MTKKGIKKESTAITSPKTEEKAIAVAQRAIADISPAMDIKVNSEPTMKRAGEYMTVIGNAKKAIEAERTGIVKPINDSVKRINSLFKPMMERAEQIESYLRKELNIYIAKLTAEADARAKEASENIDDGERVATSVKKFENTTKKLDQIPTHTVYYTEIIDFKQVPDEYKMLDEKKAQAANKAGIEVPGLKLTQKQEVTNKFN